MDNVFVVIPALDPNEILLNNLLSDLKPIFKHIVIVNDGSKSSYEKYFESLEKDNIIVLKDYINYGKGRALKSAFNYILNNYPDGKVIVTADSDGQHKVNDIINCSNKALEKQNSLILGTRSFNKKDVPLRNMLGNKITSGVFKIFVGLNVNDTQTGLRAFSFKVAKMFLDTPGERFEYETKCLIDCKEKDVPIIEVPIETIYLKNSNKNSHFRVLQDSLCIYKLFIKYILGSFSSFLIDIGLFTIFLKFIHVSNAIFICTVLARIISSYYNYLINSKIIFKKMSKMSLIKYYILVVIQMCMSGLCVTLFSKILSMNTTWIKVLVDLVIFLVNFIIQREWVFKNKIAK